MNCALADGLMHGQAVTNLENKFKCTGELISRDKRTNGLMNECLNSMSERMIFRTNGHKESE
jgi:hypothetical protein